ncbi:LRR receptor-like serine/threonine-protein kinase isoform X1 [Panicum hallii]|jgi:hypothetical protein|nr:LRR receptor-like serine/threonine-protein kinase isoform X1 [Panicum hallii]
MAPSTRTQASLLLNPFLLLICSSVSSAIGQEARPRPLLRWKSTLSPANGGDQPSSPLLSWLPAKPTCSWSGIRCDTTGHVTEISLPGAGLHGMLGALNFAAFPALTKLNLTGNNTTGAIPANVTGLMYLELSGNSLSGEIPNTLPAMVRGMRYLNLSSNWLRGPMPRWLSDMREMRSFNVSNNKLTGEIHPDLFTNCPEITSFHAQTNSLAGGIPPEISNATKLQSLLLYNNRLYGQIPVEVGRLTNLRFLFRTEFPEWAYSQFGWEHDKACISGFLQQQSHWENAARNHEFD